MDHVPIDCKEVERICQSRWRVPNQRELLQERAGGGRGRPSLRRTHNLTDLE